MAEAARLLGVDPSRVRQRLGERTLYGVKTARGWRLPAFQFDLDQPDRLVPGIGALIEQEPHPWAAPAADAARGPARRGVASSFAWA